ncbi:cobalamin biosynthesis protein CobD [Arenicella chitinivorans]|uniref:Cobalamin biosynthesis protein CobD n=1 Tax=Arenicella chitinivorans TaxID=1329800 RepID=A0A918RLY8_9GAMM|nr:adenosylcobinamide-phosphate synthase CbiB [Arenicella chitinivorans]GHA02447.1 cobalamin biosynthesis protein CobD [Arenicella chitinivorans]
MITTFLILASALLLDALLGEPKRWHPLVGFGHVAHWLERRVNRTSVQPARAFLGGLGCVVILLIVPITLIQVMAVQVNDYATLARTVFDVSLVYWAIGYQSLRQHVLAVYDALNAEQLQRARLALSMIVSRDTEQLDAQKISAATIETTLENGNDAVFGVLFWYLLGGAPMVIAYRLSNTLDAMWGYRTAQFEWFGKPAALLDDALNFLPARLVASSYALLGDYRTAITSWRAFAPLLASPNAGPVMAAGAGSLNLQLGGTAQYHNTSVLKPQFGGNKSPDSDDIPRALSLVSGTIKLWLAVIAALAVATAWPRVYY